MSTNKGVFYRIFPTEKIEFDNIKLDRTRNKIYVRHLQELSKTCMSKEPSYWEFKCDGIFWNTDQDTVSNDVLDGVLEKVMNGTNAIILAYGLVGSGKSFTISGLRFTEEEFGILPRIAKSLLEFKKQEPRNMKTCIQMSYGEFYKSCVIDLLKSEEVVLDVSKCRAMKRVHVCNYLDAMKCIFLGEGRKSFSENCNYLANLATSVATFHVIRKNTDLSNPIKICSRIHVIDLAGSDSCISSKNLCKTPKQIGMANIMKSQLEQFVLCLKANTSEDARVKQRSNALMFYLNGDFSNDSILRIIGHLKVNTQDLLVTLSMLRFGNIVRGIKMQSKKMYFDINEELEVAYLKHKLEQLEKEKYLNSTLLNQDLVSGINCDRRKQLNNLVQDYLADKVDEITVVNIADAMLVLQNLKATFKESQDEVKKLQAENQTLTAKQQKSDTSVKQRSSKSTISQSSSKLSRKSSKTGSKDSTSRNKRTSASLATEKHVTTASNEPAILDLSISQKRKKSIKSSTSGFKSLSKKKSSNASIEKRDSKSSIETLQLPIPDNVPEKQEMWIRFTCTSKYNEHLKEYKENEAEVKMSFTNYLRELKKMQNCRDAVDKCGTDLLSAQTYRKFNTKDEFDRDGMVIISDAERECSMQLKDAQSSLTEQQEKVLTAQEILKAHIENRKNIMKQTEEEFDQFCTDNYQLPNVDVEMVQNTLEEYTFDADLNKSLEEVEITEITQIPEVPDSTRVVRNLQKLMVREREKRKKIIYEKNREWRNVYS